MMNDHWQPMSEILGARTRKDLVKNMQKYGHCLTYQKRHCGFRKGSTKK